MELCRVPCTMAGRVTITLLLCYVLHQMGQFPSASTMCLVVSMIAQLLIGAIFIQSLQEYKKTGLKLVIDSAFCTARFPLLIKSLQDYLTADNNLLTYNEQIQELTIKREATSMRQSAEWWMQGVQSSFPRLKELFNSKNTVKEKSLFLHFFYFLTYEQGW